MEPALAIILSFYVYSQVAIFVQSARLVPHSTQQQLYSDRHKIGQYFADEMNRQIINTRHADKL